MKLIGSLFIFLFIRFIIHLIIRNTASDYIEVYIVSGQSNTIGFNSIDSYTPSPFSASLSTQSDILLWLGSNAVDILKNKWTFLQVGTSLAAPKGFGPEISFGRTMRRNNPKTQSAIIKNAVGGTGIAQSVYYNDFIPEFYKQ